MHLFKTLELSIQPLLLNYSILSAIPNYYPLHKTYFIRITSRAALITVVLYTTLDIYKSFAVINSSIAPFSSLIKRSKLIYLLSNTSSLVAAAKASLYFLFIINEFFFAASAISASSTFLISSILDF